MIFIRIMNTIRFRTKKAREFNNIDIIKECNILFEQWYKESYKLKNISMIEKIIVKYNINLKFIYKIKEKLYKKYPRLIR